VLILLAAPVVTHLLPACRSHLGENYQPLRTLKFVHSRGREFHKWGPMPNFMLAPGYGASLAIWALEGSFSGPTDEFPYGLQDPVRQLTTLIVQGRVLFLIIGVLGIAWLLVELGVFIRAPGAVLVAALLCLSTNHVLVLFLPNTRPDGPMIAFSAAALAAYLRIVDRGWTARRALILAAAAVAAVSSKELAAAMLVGPAIGLVAVGWRAPDPVRRRQTRRGVTVAAITSVLAYVLLNVVYAPHTWWLRMRYWTVGVGKDSSIWGEGLGAGASGWQYALDMGAAWLSNLGPGGAPVVAAAIVALVVLRPARWLLLLLPLLSAVLIGLVPMGYAHDRFYLIAALTATPPAAAGLAVLWERLPVGLPRTLTSAVLGVMVAANLLFATLAWHVLATVEQALIERHAAAHVEPDASINHLDDHRLIVDASRLARLGYDVDPRAIQDLRPEDSRPDWIYAKQGKLAFLEDAARLPARAAMLRRDSGFDVDRWSGLDALGFDPAATIVPETPGWFPFGWMPAARRHARQGTVLVFRRRVDDNRGVP
jgi:hypothetical protein